LCAPVLYCAVDLKELVVTEMCEDKRTIVELFQRCGREELKFLTNSGLFFGFLLGLIQMVVWLFYDNPWTLTIGGTIVVGRGGCPGFRSTLGLEALVFIFFFVTLPDEIRLSHLGCPVTHTLWFQVSSSKLQGFLLFFLYAVGYLTNWLALKCIFEPVEPVYLWGRFKIQGLFLQRQTEVSRELSDHLAGGEVALSQNVRTSRGLSCLSV